MIRTLNDITTKSQSNHKSHSVDAIKPIDINQQILSKGIYIQQKKDVDIIITLYKDGYRVNHEQFQHSTTTDTKNILQEIAEGKLPKLLFKKFKNDIDIGIIDCSTEYGDHKAHTILSKDDMENNEKNTFIKFRLPNGTSTLMEFNKSCPLKVVLSTVSKQYKLAKNSVMLTGFPPVQISHLDMTILESKLEKATIIIKDS